MCMYICIYIYICTYIYTYRHRDTTLDRTAVPHGDRQGYSYMCGAAVSWQAKT